MQERQLPISDNGFTAAVLREMLLIMEASKTMDEIAFKWLPVLKQDNWDNWEPTFVNYLKTLKSASDIPLECII